MSHPTPTSVRRGRVAADATEERPASPLKESLPRKPEGQMKAMDDMTQAVKNAQRARDNLKGYVFQMAGEVITRLPVTRDTTAQFNRYMAAAGRILRAGKIEEDGSGAYLTAAGYHQDRARGYLRLGQIDAALDEI